MLEHAKVIRERIPNFDYFWARENVFDRSLKRLGLYWSQGWGLVSVRLKVRTCIDGYRFKRSKR